MDRGGAIGVSHESAFGRFISRNIFFLLFPPQGYNLLFSLKLGIYAVHSRNRGWREVRAMVAAAATASLRIAKIPGHQPLVILAP